MQITKEICNEDFKKYKIIIEIENKVDESFLWDFTKLDISIPKAVEIGFPNIWGSKTKDFLNIIRGVLLHS